MPKWHTNIVPMLVWHNYGFIGDYKNNKEDYLNNTTNSVYLQKKFVKDFFW